MINDYMWVNDQINVSTVLVFVDFLINCRTICKNVWVVSRSGHIYVGCLWSRLKQNFIKGDIC
jgi:hypothetical protein